MTDSSLVNSMVLILAFLALMFVASKLMYEVWGKITIKIEKGWATIFTLFISLFYFAAAIVMMVWIIRMFMMVV